jgi:hypothetical protein
VAVTFATGFEARNDATDGMGITGTAGYSTAQHRTGAASARCNPASGANGNFSQNVGTANYPHFGLYVASLPTVARSIAGWYLYLHLVLNTNGTIAVYNGATLIGTSSTALSTATWYWIGFRNVTGTSVSWLRINGVDAGVSGTATVTAANIYIGMTTTEASAIDLYFDDLVVDGAGFLASSKVGLAVPISDNAIGTGWVGGAGGTTNLYTGVDNKPPVGVADTGTNTSQIRNATSAISNYDANLQTYTTVGVGASDTVIAVQPVIATAAPVTTSAKLGTVGLSSNPAITNIALGAGGTAGAFWSGLADGTYPTGWKVSFGTLTTSPSVTLGSSPVMRVTQSTASTRIADVCFMGLVVAWTPAGGTAWTQTASEATSTADTATRVALEGRSVTEQSIAQPNSVDVATRVLLALRSATEATSTTDVAAEVIAHPRSVTEATSTADAISRTLSALRTATEAPTSADAAARVALELRSTTEASTTTDVVTRLWHAGRSVTEAPSTADAATRVAIASRSATEATSSADAATRLALESRTVSEAPSTADAATDLKTKAVAASEAPSTADTATRRLTAARSATEAPASADLATRVALESRTATEAPGSADIITRSLGTHRSATEAPSSVDVASRAATEARSTTEAPATVDTATRVAAEHRSAAEASSSADAITRTVGPNRTASEATSSVDTATRSLNAARSEAEAPSTADTAARAGTFARSVSEAELSADLAIRVAGLARTAAETPSTTDAAGVVIAHGSQSVFATEATSSSDAATRNVVLFRSAGEHTTSADATTDVVPPSGAIGGNLWRHYRYSIPLIDQRMHDDEIALLLLEAS